MSAGAPPLPAGWTPVALSRDLPAGTSLGAVCGGAEIVVWRDRGGTVRAWEDRCPHRGMKLSFGFVRGDRLACLYHGWSFDGQGRCRTIPSHPDLAPPETIRVAGYDAREALGMVWAANAGTGPATPVDEPDAAPLTPLRSLFVAAPVAVAAGALAQAGLAVGTAGAGEPVTGVDRHPGWMRLEQDGLRLVAGLQPVDAGHSALHLAAEGRLAPHQARALVRASAGLRRDIEGEAAR